jgi:tetratricopeptide (TPR) repeat protein
MQGAARPHRGARPGRPSGRRALGGAPSDEALALLEKSARDADDEAKSDRMQTTLCEAFANAGQGARDGGRTRGSLLRRAASLAHNSLSNTDRAFELLGEALVTHVEASSLDALESLSREVNDLRRAEATLTRALGEVFDGPLVRLLLARRAKLRRHDLDDGPGAAADLKKLHDLSPGDQSVSDDLAQLLTSLGDYRGLVALYEDLILRGKDQALRADLARKVARMWEEQLVDPREAADAWRRVLRLKPNDPDATQGLDRAKSNMLKRPSMAPSSETELPSPPSGKAKPSGEPPSAALPKEEEGAEARGAEDGEAHAAEGTTTDRPEARPPQPEAVEGSGDDAAQASADSSDSAGPHDAAAAAPTAETDGAITKPPPAGMPVDVPAIPEPPPALASGEDVVFDVDEEMAADDMIMDVEEAPPEKTSTPPGKRSIPPPLPRS